MGKKDSIKIDFCGTNATEVTGSCIWIKTPERQVLLELGLYQSCGSTLDNYKINNKSFKFKAKDIDYVFVCHTHADHLCRVPLLFKRGGDAKLIAPENTKPLAEILLNDSANIMVSDAEELSKKFNRDYSPIYDQSDVQCSLNHYCEYKIGDIVWLDEYIKFRFVPSGHILNSAQLELWVTSGNITKKIAYTSDLGNVHIDKYYTNKYAQITKADIFIGESTYANNDKVANKSMRKKDLDKLKSAILQTCVDNGGRVLIPVFAQDRAQNMLTCLYDLFGSDNSFNVPVLIDSPMAVRMCGAYSNILSGDSLDKWKEVLSWKNIVLVRDYVESRSWREVNNPVIVLSSSGMIVSRGRSAAWAHSVLPVDRDRIIFCGYAAEGSIANTIKNGGQKTITISGDKVKNRCQVTVLNSFSSHMQRDSLLRNYGKVNAEKLVLVHGDMNGKIEFSKKLQEELSKNDLTTRVICANKDYSLTLR